MQEQKSGTKARRVFIRKAAVAVAALILLAAAAFGIYKLTAAICAAVASVSDFGNSISYTAADFDIDTCLSGSDFNKNGVDDYADMVNGARAYVLTKPVYDASYFSGGYPDEGKGVCTDVIWKAFEAAGYSLKDMVDADIAANTDAYPRTEGVPDPNIDFRRVSNLQVFFTRYAQSLTVDTSKIAEWQPGDIVVFKSLHIAIISDKRNSRGIPYIIHNGGAKTCGEQNRLCVERVIAHFRFDFTSVSGSDVQPANGQ